MERLNDLLKSLIGILLIISFVAAFSSCDNEPNPDNDDEEVIVKDTSSEEPGSSSWEEEFKKESRELEVRLENLEQRAKEKGGEWSAEIQAELKELNEERKNILNDSTAENIERRWEEFKNKAKTELDSLDRKI